MGCFSPSDTWNSYSQALQGSGRALVPLETNLVDQVWGDQRPPPASSEIYSLPAEFTGTEPPPRTPWPFFLLFFGGGGVQTEPLAHPPLPGSSWQEKVSGIRQQMEEHTRSPTALLLSGLEETACEWPRRGWDRCRGWDLEQQTRASGGRRS